MTLSHEDYLLLILADGRWHKLSEILRERPMMVHSRAAGLRAKGFTVENRKVGVGATGSEYRLVGGLSGDEPWRGDPGRRRPASLASGPPGPSSPLSPSEPLDVAAEERQTGRLTPNPASDRSLPARGSGSSRPPHVAACAGASASTSSGPGWWEPSPPAPSLEDGAAAGGATPTSRQLSLLEAA